MTYSAALRKSLPWAFYGLLIGSLIASLLFDFLVLPHSAPRDVGGTLTRAIVIFYFSLCFAAPATLLYGWPVYSFLLYRGWDRLVVTMTIPLIPAALVYPHSSTIGQAIMLFGTCIAVVGRMVQWVRSNNSFKP
jgi:hypothetical protein